MHNQQTITIDGNQAAASIAHKTNEVIAIYPITPSSNMGEWADEWSAKGQKNLWGTVPQVIEMQSEAGAAGTIHGALQAGSLATTFTASQGLLLMIPNMYKIAGELSPAVFHIAARSLACQGLSIFGDHSDIMAARSTGFALLCSNSPQEALDMALIAQAATLESRIPIMHFFDGFRTSHEVAKMVAIDDDTIRAMIDDKFVHAHRQRGLTPDNPVIRGTAQNPDVYFQGRETVNPFYNAMPEIVQNVMNRFAELTGRQYRLFEYFGAENAERVIVLMGSGVETALETVDYLNRQGESVGVLAVRLFRPFSAESLIAEIPSSCKKIAVLDRTKEVGADGEPLYKDVLTAIVQNYLNGNASALPKIVGGRYGLSSKEFTPAMVKAVFDELAKDAPKNGFTVGIHDDVTHTSLDFDEHFRTDAHSDTMQAMFYGLGSDGTVGANKNSIKIIGEATDFHAQGYFVYDSKKSGAITVSHLRFGSKPIHSSYLISDNDANFIGCHQTIFLHRYDMLKNAAPNSVFLLNSPEPVDKVWDSLPAKMQQQMIEKNIRFYVIDGYAVAEKTGMGKRINTIMQTCFFAISGVLPQDEAIAAIKHAVEKTYGKKGQRIVELNFKAIDETLANLHLVPLTTASPTKDWQSSNTATQGVSDFVKQVTMEIIAGRGDHLPVSLMPVDGTFPVGTAAVEKRNLALEIPVWETDLCTQCGKCAMVCPHAAIRSKIYSNELLDNAPDSFKHAAMLGKDFPAGLSMTYQVAPEDCTGCTLCVDICPIRDKSNASRKALNMSPQPALLEQERDNWEFFINLPEYDRTKIKTNTIKGAMVMQPLFEFSGACVGCGETPYLKLASQLFGDRMVIANATGCSSIYGGNLPTTPWTKNKEGRGVAWSNSLFEDNAEFGLGMRLSIDKHKEQAEELLLSLSDILGFEVFESLVLTSDQSDEAGIHEQRERVAELKKQLVNLDHPNAKALLELADYLCKKSVWIVGGDGWAYDIGYGGLDHVLASGRNVNILVLDTEVYSNTGGQTSKSTPLGAVAKFSAAGKATNKKDLALLAMDYGNVYVAHVSYAGKDVQTLNAFLEAEAYEGVSIIIAYSPCIAHGVDMSNNHRQQNLAVKSGHWPLFRFNPAKIKLGKNPMQLDSPEPSIAYRDFVKTETRFFMLWQSHPEEAEAFLAQAQKEVTHRYHYYKQLSELDWHENTSASAIKVQMTSTKEQSNG